MSEKTYLAVNDWLIDAGGGRMIPVIQDKKYTVEDYYNTSEDDHVELINGVFYDMAPPSRKHQRISMQLSILIGNYIRENNGPCQAYAAPFGIQLSADDDTTIVEPDISVICDKEKLTDRGCTGAPDWIIEIVSPGNPAHDYIRKLNLYYRAGVRLYWIVDPDTESVAIYDFENKELIPAEYSFNDKVKVSIYSDFIVDFEDIKKELQV